MFRSDPKDGMLSGSIDESSRNCVFMHHIEGGEDKEVSYLLLLLDLGSTLGAGLLLRLALLQERLRDENVIGGSNRSTSSD